jgi:MoaA/NifB/PqqE/SkfB family radical SAM enzyme
MMNTLALLPGILATWARYNLLQPLRRAPFRPRILHLIPTHRCNARCVMCGLWDDQASADGELNTEQWRRLLSDRLFSKLQYVGISGGEPFLRRDLMELIGIFVENNPGLKRVSITTNGLLTERIDRQLETITSLLSHRGVLLDLSVSFHATGDTLDTIYGVDRAFEKSCLTLAMLKQRRNRGQLSCSLNCVLLRDNLEQASGLLRWAAEQELPLSFVLGEERERFHNQACRERFLGPEDQERLTGFISSLAAGFSLANPSAMKYEEILRMLEEGRERTLSCYYAFAGVLLGNDGTLYYCSHSAGIGNAADTPASRLFYDRENLNYRREKLLRAECRRCPPYTLTRLELGKDILKLAGRAAGKRMGKLWRKS